MDSHPLLQAPSQDTCAYFQRTSESASAPFSKCPTFPSERAAHYSRLFRFVNTSFRGPTPPLHPQTRRLFVEASRLLWQPFRCRPHLREGDFNFFLRCQPVGRRRRSGSMQPLHDFVKRPRRRSGRWTSSIQPLIHALLPAAYICDFRPQPAARGRRCACLPAAGLRSPAAGPSARLRRRCRPPSPRAP